MIEQPSSDLAEPKSKTVLIVDDDESVLNLLEILIRRDGFKIDLATTGEQAMSRLKRKPDAMVLDLMLPGSTSGFQVLKLLRQTPGPVPPVIVVTAYAHAKEVQEVQKDPNVLLFLAKPINQNKLLGALHRVLRTRSPHALQEGGDGEGQRQAEEKPQDKPKTQEGEKKPQV